MIISIKITSYIYDDLNVQPQKNILCKLGSFISNTNVNLIMRFITNFSDQLINYFVYTIQLLTFNFTITNLSKSIENRAATNLLNSYLLVA